MAISKAQTRDLKLVSNERENTFEMKGKVSQLRVSKARFEFGDDKTVSPQVVCCSFQGKLEF
jgi:hypothetical protein